MPRRPINGPVEISGDRATHAEYNVGPATDYKVGRGTTIRAPFPGVLSAYYSITGGNTIVVDGVGATMFGQHLADYHKSSGSCSEGQAIAVSGNTGTATTGPHFHWWVILDNGTRISGEEWANRVGLGFTPLGRLTPPGTAPAGGGTKPLPQEDEDMASPIEYIYAFANGSDSWCWLNWASGTVWSAHTVADATWVAGYMQGYTGPAEKVTEEQYNSKVAFCQMLNPKATATVDFTALSKAVSGMVVEALKPLLVSSGSVVTQEQIDSIVQGVVEQGLDSNDISTLVQDELSKLVLKTA